MSAFMCSRSHIATIAQFAADSGRLHHDCEPGGVHGLANLLMRQNARSVDHRYHQEEETQALELFESEDEVSSYARPEFLNPVCVLKLCQSLEYQSCETADWRETAAFDALQAIMSRSIGRLAGYEAAPWACEDVRRVVPVSLYGLATRGLGGRGVRS